MKLRTVACFFTGLLSALSAFATDYELIVPAGNSAIQSARVLCVFDGTGKLKSGDRIVAVRFGEPASGTGFLIATAAPAQNKAILAPAGSAVGFDGEIVLGAGKAVGRTQAAALASVGAVSAQRLPEAPKAAFPWIWFLGGIGAVIVCGALYRMVPGTGKGGGVGAVATVNSKGIERLIRDLQSQISKLAEHQPASGNSEAVAELGRGITVIAERLVALENAVKAAPVAEGAASADPTLADAIGKLSAKADATESHVASLIELVSAMGSGAPVSPEAAAEQVEAAKARTEAAEALRKSVEALESRLASMPAAGADGAHLKLILEKLDEPRAQAAPTELEPILEKLGSLSHSREPDPALASAIGHIEMRLQEISTALEAERQAPVDLAPVLERLDALGSGPEADPTLVRALSEVESSVKALAEAVAALQASQPSASDIAAQWTASNPTDSETAKFAAAFSSIDEKLQSLSSALAQQEAALADTLQRVQAEAGVPDYSEKLDLILTAQAELAASKSSSEAFESKVSELAEIAARSQAAVASLHASIEASTLARGAADAQAIGDTTALAEALAPLTALPAEVSDLSAKLASFQAKSDAAGEKLEAISSLLSAWHNEQSSSVEVPESVRETRQVVSHLGESFGALESRVADLSHLAAATGESIQALSSDFSQWREAQPSTEEGSEGSRFMAVAEAIGELTASTSALRADVEAVGERASKTEQSVEAVRDLVAALGTASGADSSALEHRWEQWTASQSTIASVAESIQAFGPAMESLQQRYDSLQRDLGALNASVEELATRPAPTASGDPLDGAWSGFLSALPSSLETIADRLSEIEASRAQTQSEISKLAESLESGRATDLASGSFDGGRVSEFSSAVDSATAQLGALSEQAQAAEAGLRSIEQHAAMLQATIDRISRQAQETSQWMDKSDWGGGAQDSEMVVLTPADRSEEPVRLSADDAEEVLAKFVEPETPSFDGPVYAIDEGADVESPNHGVDDEPVEAGHAPAWNWGCANGGPWRHGCLDARSDLLLREPERAAKALTPPDTPESSFPVRNVLFALGQVVYAHGDRLCGFWPGRDDKSVFLQAEVPAGAWRLQVVNGVAFAALEQRVEMVNLSTWSKQAGFQGVFIDQLHTMTDWVGVAADDGDLSIEFRDSSGQLTNPAATLPIDPSQYVGSAGNGEHVFFGARDGRVFTATGAGAKSIGAFALGKGGELKFLALHGKSLVAITSEPKGCFVRTMDFTGGHPKEIDLGCLSYGGQPVIAGDQMFIFDAEMSELISCNLRKHKVHARERIAGIESVRSMTGVRHEDAVRLLVVAADGGQQAGSAIVLDPDTKKSVTLGAVGANTHAEFIPADARVVLSTSTSYQNIIRVFEPFGTAIEKADAA